MTEINKGGRPLKFKTPQALAKAIKAYFDSCFEPEMRHVLKKEAREREADKKIPKYTADDYEWVQEVDWKGDKIFTQVKPFTITGLALALNTSRQTLVNYEARDRFFDTIKDAKLRCENHIEEGLLVGKVPAAAGIFNLKNNYEWKDDQHLTHDVGGTLADLMREEDGETETKGKTKKKV